MNDPKQLKMYIAILDDVPDEFAPVIAAHASLIAHMNWSGVIPSGYDKDNKWKSSHPDMQEWYDWKDYSFKKCVLRVNKKEFEKLRALEYNKVLTESALDGREVAIVLCPRYEIPNVMRFAKLWKPVPIKVPFVVSELEPSPDSWSEN